MVAEPVQGKASAAQAETFRSPVRRSVIQPLRRPAARPRPGGANPSIRIHSEWVGKEPSQRFFGHRVLLLGKGKYRSGTDS
jgi:hypothetical protein